MKKLLIANRGEIAVRVIRTAQEMGIGTVAVFSDADAHMPFVALADEAVNIGEPEPAASYLNAAAILGAARSTGADAIHPGYGFLSESPAFAAAVEEAGLTFVGPSPASMRKLGAKIDAKALAVSVGVPVTPGFFEHEASPEMLEQEAAKLGYPVMLKASAGGGGRGMRVVFEPGQFADSLRTAAAEAANAFGDGAMMVEKLVQRPRHIEVQILADGQGGVAALFERECSVQRRHQKLIEEAPSPGIDAASYQNLQGWARDLALAAGYRGAGTVEFMLDPASGALFFLEVNARLQVEHPVTEAITGLDLVAWQIRIARGERLPERLTLGRENMQGHAIEARVIAEDPAMGFRPSVGSILAWAEPKRPGVRVETGYGPGQAVSPFYDSLLAKVIAHAETREAAIAKLRSALLDFHVLGVATNIPFLLDVLAHPLFLSGQADTEMLAREFGDWTMPDGVPPELAAILHAGPSGEKAGSGTRGASDPAWGVGDSWRNTR